MKTKTYPYVGLIENGLEVFRSEHRHDLVSGLCPKPYRAVIGPFRTLRAARYMEANPRCESVADAEYFAKLATGK